MADDFNVDDLLEAPFQQKTVSSFDCTNELFQIDFVYLFG